MSLIACGGDDDGPGEMMDPVTRTYVVSTISIPSTSQTYGDPAPGFNLDGMDTMGDPNAESCVDRVADYTSQTDPGEAGVDNALGGLVETLAGFVGDLDMTIAEQITEGSILVMMEVRDINSYTNDSSVQVQLYLGSVPGGGAPMISGSTLAPGQMFDAEPIGSVQMGSIVNGRLRVVAPLITLGINTGDINLDLNIRQAQVRANISETGLTNGAIGGSLRVEDIVAAVAMIQPDLVDTARMLLEGLADLEPAADPDTCQALSVGILFSGVRAEINP